MQCSYSSSVIYETSILKLSKIKSNNHSENSSVTCFAISLYQDALIKYIDEQIDGALDTLREIVKTNEAAS